MAMKLQRMKVRPGSEQEVRAWATAPGSPAVLEAHRALGLRREILFLDDQEGVLYVYVFTEADDLATLSARAAKIDDPEFRKTFEQFRSWFESATELPQAGWVIVGV
jgi:Family of unknown function (DUF6176)